MECKPSRRGSTDRKPLAEFPLLKKLLQNLFSV